MLLDFLKLLWEQKDIINPNKELFITYGLLCFTISVSLCGAFNSFLNKNSKLKYEKAREKIEILENDVETLIKEKEDLENTYNKLDILPRLRGGVNNEPPATSSELISKAMNKK